jgi:hypothetical protein
MHPVPGFLRFQGGRCGAMMWHVDVPTLRPRAAVRAVDPQVDEAGYFFVCPGCDGRNTLNRVGRSGPRDSVEFEQPEA